MKKLTKKEIKDVLSKYNLGELNDVNYHKGGMISYIFEFKTSRGAFIVRRLGYQFNWYHRRQKKLEFGVLEYLYKKDFPYEIPRFLKNKNGNYVSRIKGNLFEVYKKLEGNHNKDLNKENVEEFAKGLAIYHNAIKGYRPGKKLEVLRGYRWALGEYDKMKKVKPKNELDRLMLKNVDYFIGLLKELVKLNLAIDVLATHSDFSQHNLLFNEGNLTGILDFENIGWDSKAYDVAYVLRRNFKLKDSFLKEYRKHIKFSKREEKNIVPYILLNLCNMFWWVYRGMKKRPDLKVHLMKRTIRQTKQFYKEFK